MVGLEAERETGSGSRVLKSVLYGNGGVKVFYDEPRRDGEGVPESVRIVVLVY